MAPTGLFVIRISGAGSTPCELWDQSRFVPVAIFSNLYNSLHVKKLGSSIKNVSWEFSRTEFSVNYAEGPFLVLYSLYECSLNNYSVLPSFCNIRLQGQEPCHPIKLQKDLNSAL